MMPFYKDMSHSQLNLILILSFQLPRVVCSFKHIKIYSYKKLFKVPVCVIL